MDDITILFHLLATAPPWAQRIVAGLLVAVALATLYMRAYPKLQALAASTETKRDDQAVSAGAFVAQWVLALFSWVKWVPRLTVGEPAPQAPASYDDGPPTRPMRPVPSVLPPFVVFAFWLACTATALYAAGCGPAQAQALHQGLTDATDLVDPMYAQAVVECDLQEREVIASHTPDQVDAADVALAAVRVRCDVALAAFAAVRDQQLALRVAADAMADGRATVTDVVRALDELAAAVETSRALVTAVRAARRGAP